MMDLIEQSLRIALNAHAGQLDRAGKPYILHPLRMMTKMETDEEMSVAILHDVVEDADITAEDLFGKGIPKRVVDAVQALSKIDGETYEQFIDRVMEDNLAQKVKKVDIEDNINLLRLSTIGEDDLNRVAKYHWAWHKLSGN